MGFHAVRLRATPSPLGDKTGQGAHWGEARGVGGGGGEGDGEAKHEGAHKLDDAVSECRLVDAAARRLVGVGEMEEASSERTSQKRGQKIELEHLGDIEAVQEREHAHSGVEGPARHAADGDGTGEHGVADREAEV